MSFLSPEEVHRYSRHLILPEFGAKGQKQLKNARVLIVGLGGLGCPAAMYLAAAGVGTLGLVEFDVVDLSNLQRQVLYTAADVGQPKLEVAGRRLKELNPHVHIRPHALRLHRDNAVALFQDYDVVLDGTDNFATRYLINDACLVAGRPSVSASVFRFEGQVSVFGLQDGPCYRCLYPEPPPPGVVSACGEGGVLGILPGVIGTLQATEAIKVVTHIGQPLQGRLLTFDALEMRFRSFQLKKNRACSACGENASLGQLPDYETWCGLKRQPGDAVPEVTPQWLAANRQRVQLIDIREEGEREINSISPSLSIPWSELKVRFTEIHRNQDIVLYCKVGERSARAVELLLGLGFTGVSHLAGGIERWIDEVDETLPHY